MSQSTEPYTLSASEPQTRGWSSTDLLMLITVLIWGINFTVVKIALSSFSPLVFTSVRFGLATITILAIMRLRGESFHLSGWDVLGMIVLGLVGHTAYQALFINGLAHTGPGNASLLSNTSPIFVAIYSHIFRIERANRTIWAGIGVAFAGIALLILGGPDGIHLENGAILGDLLIVAGAMFWAAYTALSKRMLGHMSALKMTAMAMLFGTVPLIMISTPDLLRQNWAAVPLGHWAGLVFSSVFSIVVGYTIWSISVQRVGNARTVIYSYLTPVIAVVVAWIVLGSRLALLQGLGALVVLAGLLLTRRGKVR